MKRLEGEDGDWAWAIRPDLGASIVRLEWQGRPILRRVSDPVSTVLETGCFPLVPYANRIGWGRFESQGEPVQLPVLEAFAPHALHGDGWLCEWKVAEGPAASTLVYRHDAGAWPWEYQARQTLEFDGPEAVITLSVENLSDRPMPWGLGLHPYFPAGPETRLAFDATGVWETSEDALPIRLSDTGAVFDWSSGPRVSEAPFTDHCYTGCGPARLIHPDHEVQIWSSPNARHAQVYAPGGDFVCFEPVTHRPDVFNATKGDVNPFLLVEPGGARTVVMGLRVSTR